MIDKAPAQQRQYRTYSYWLLEKSVNGLMETLTIDCAGETALPVFSFKEEAEMFSLFEGSNGDGEWQARETGSSKLLSMLLDPSAAVKAVKRVALDPLPEMVADGAGLELVSVSRRQFTERLVASEIPQPLPGGAPGT